nr:unnamed protein product [Callosobruchus chinensis]
MVYMHIMVSHGATAIADYYKEALLQLMEGAIPQSTPPPLPTGGVGGVRRTLSGWREWRRADPTLINSLWRSKMGNGIRKQLGEYLQ